MFFLRSILTYLIERFLTFLNKQHVHCLNIQITSGQEICKSHGYVYPDTYRSVMAFHLLRLRPQDNPKSEC